MMPDGKQSYLNEALSWVNDVRHSMGAPPVGAWPKSIPGSERHCLLARAIREENRQLISVRISGSCYAIEYMTPHRAHLDCVRYAYSGEPISVSTRMPERRHVEGELPHACKRVVRMFDNGDLPEHIDYEEMGKRNVAATPPHLKGTPVPPPPPTAGVITASMIEQSYKQLTQQFLMPAPPPALAAICPVPAEFDTPDWLSILKTPEAPVTKSLEEEAEAST